MKHKILLALIFGVVFPLIGFSQCLSTQVKIGITLKTDDYPAETSWTLKNQMGQILLQGGPYQTSQQNVIFRDSVCVGEMDCVTFEIFDQYNDGICCGFGDGYFQLSVDGTIVDEGGDFGASYTYRLNCPPGSDCGNALAVNENTTHTTAVEPTHWYAFTPSQTGLYGVSTCDSSNACNTVIWMYDHCQNLNYDDGLTGIAFYNDDHCGDRASLEVALIGGNTYYIRIGSVNQNCQGIPIEWSLNFIGEISGCMDPNSCNFEPLATIDDGNCIPVGSPDCPEGPDLRIDGPLIRSSMFIDYIQNGDQCLVEEGCLHGYGERQLIKFDTRIENIGTQDYFIGQTPANINSSDIQWEWDECHSHWHYEGYAQYLIYDENGVQLPASFKNGFCVLDLDCPQGITAKYSCFNQGITAGCADIYGAYLDCQWIDITNIPDGRYTLAVAVNWDKSPDKLGRVEMDYENNWAQVCFDLVRTNGIPSFTFVDVCPTIIDCAGEPQGNAVTDCEGTCQGTAKQGDINTDTNRNIADILQYFDESLATNPTVTNCKDLNNDGVINVLDAALLIECVLHEGQPPLPGHAHAPCQFPFNITNPQDSVWFHIGEVNQTEGWFDVEIYNPKAKVNAFQMAFEGVVINSVLPLNTTYNGTYKNNENEVLCVSLNEENIPKNLTQTPLFRVYVSEFTSDTICVSQVEGIMNDVRERIIGLPGTCSFIVGTKDNKYNAAPPIHLAPNPVTNVSTLYISPEFGKKVSITITNLQGVLISKTNIYNESYWNLEKGQLPSGTYIISVTNGKVARQIKAIIL